MSTIQFVYELRPDTPGREYDEAQLALSAAGRTIWDILTAYVQPNSTSSLDDTIDQTVQFWNDSTRYYNTLVALPVTLAEQIPYDHPAHQKLAEYVRAMVESGKWLPKSIYESRRSAEGVFWESFGRLMDDTNYKPDDRFEDGEDPLMYANFCAFIANMENEAASPTPQVHPYLTEKEALDSALKVDPAAPVEVRDAWVIGAAQGIIYRAPALFGEVLKSRKRDAEANKTKDGPQPKPRWTGYDYLWDDWQAWKRMFATTASDETYGKICRDVAKKAADLMALQEKNAMEDE